MGILGELDRAGLIDTSVKRIGYNSLASCLTKYDIKSERLSQKARKFYLSCTGWKIQSGTGRPGVIISKPSTPTVHADVSGTRPMPIPKTGGLRYYR